LIISVPSGLRTNSSIFGVMSRLGNLWMHVADVLPRGVVCPVLLPTYLTAMNHLIPGEPTPLRAAKQAASRVGHPFSLPALPRGKLREAFGDREPGAFEPT